MYCKISEGESDNGKDTDSTNNIDNDSSNVDIIVIMMFLVLVRVISPTTAAKTIKNISKTPALPLPKTVG